MKKYLLDLLNLRMLELTNQKNKLGNQYRSATASGLSGLNESIGKVQEEMERIKIYKERLEELDID